MANDTDIHERVQRVERIIEQLDADNCSRDDGEELYQEGQQLLDEIREILEVDRGQSIEIE